MKKASFSKKMQLENRNWILNDLQATLGLGELLIQKFSKLKILFLEGPLGAGKTSIIKGIGNGLKIKEPITSPTFALSHHYNSGIRPLIHLDLYRLEEVTNANAIFLQEEEEAIAIDAVLVVEWPERLSLKIKEAYQLKLKYLPNNKRHAQLYSPIADSINS